MLISFNNNTFYTFSTLILRGRGELVCLSHNILSRIVEYDAIFDELYAKTIGQMNVETSIPYTKVELIHYHKKYTIWKIDVNNLSAC